jgi:predicted nucleic acid-binding protein
MDQVFIVLASVAVSTMFLQLIVNVVRTFNEFSLNSRVMAAHAESRSFNKWYKNAAEKAEKDQLDTYVSKPFVSNMYKVLTSKDKSLADDIGRLEAKNTELTNRTLVVLTLLKEAGEGKLEPAEIVKRIKDMNVLPEDEPSVDVDDEETPL